MGRMYNATFSEVAVTAIQDLIELNAPADAVVIIHSIIVSQSSDAGDAQSEQLNLLIHRGSTSGSGGSVVTPTPLDLGTPAFGGTVEANNTTQSTTGVILHSESFNVMGGINIIFTPETRPIVSPSTRLIVELTTTPADSLTMSATITFEEIGG